jgi:hypothetical protein
MKKYGKTKNTNLTYYPQIKVQPEKLKPKCQKDEAPNANLISKMWRENIAKYGKDLNVFFGSLKP